MVWSPTVSLLEFPFKGPQPAPPLCLQRLENVFIAILITLLCQEVLGCCNSSTSRSDGVKNFMPALPSKRTRSASEVRALNQEQILCQGSRVRISPWQHLITPWLWLLKNRNLTLVSSQFLAFRSLASHPGAWQATMVGLSFVIHLS